MLSLPPDWDFSVAGLVAINKEKKDSISAALKELKEAGYLVVTRLTPDRTDSGRYEYIYDVFELPQKTRAEKQGIVFQDIEIQAIENPPQLNKEKENKDKRNKDNKMIVPTLEEVKEYAEEAQIRTNIERFYDYYSANGWKQGKGKPIVDWRAALRNWSRNDFSKTEKHETDKQHNKSYDISEVEDLFDGI
jgi:hypothetical protein